MAKKYRKERFSMTPTPHRILVHFHEVEQGLIHIPERYTVHTQQSWDDNESRVAVTTDRRLINPQIVDVLSGQYAGQQAFVYYGAYETAKWPNPEQGIIAENMLLFLINPVRVLGGSRLCEEIRSEAPRTASGIYTTSQMGTVEAVRVRDVQTGQVIITTDSAQYKLKFEGKEYVLVKEQFIAGIDEHPYRDNLLIEYTEQPDLEREARNERKRRERDLMDSYRMFYDPKEYEPEPLPKFTTARVLEGEYDGEEVIVERNYGVSVGLNRAIIPPDALVAVKHGLGEGDTA